MAGIAASRWSIDRKGNAGMSQEVATCTCGQAIYRNTSPNASIRIWAHRSTGSRYCDRSETHTASPREVAV